MNGFRYINGNKCYIIHMYAILSNVVYRELKIDSVGDYLGDLHPLKAVIRYMQVVRNTENLRFM